MPRTPRPRADREAITYLWRFLHPRVLACMTAEERVACHAAHRSGLIR